MTGSRATELLQITDTHLLARPGETLLGVDTTASLAGVLDAAARVAHPQLMLATGDLGHDGEAGSYRRLRELAAKRFEAPLRWLPGNHDAPEVLEAVSTGEADEEAWVDSAWAVLTCSTHVPGEEGGRLGDARLERLHALLERHAGRHVLLAMHHPPLPVGAPWLDAIGLADADALAACLADHGHVRGIVCGHVHQVFEGTFAGVPVWTTPSTCFQFAPHSERFGVDDSAPGWRRIWLHGDGRVRTEVGRMDEATR